MKTIGILSDTHLQKVDENFALLFERGGVMNELDTLIHAGDFTSANILDFLEARYVVYGVQGNMDEMAIRERLPLRRIVELEGVRIGIVHGWGAPVHLDRRVYDFFNDDTLDCIVFGHSHIPVCEVMGKTLMFNPGSYKGKWPSRERSIGRLIIEGETVRGEILPL